jgi:hypothetical protein
MAQARRRVELYSDPPRRAQLGGLSKWPLKNLSPDVYFRSERTIEGHNKLRALVGRFAEGN